MNARIRISILLVLLGLTLLFIVSTLRARSRFAARGLAESRVTLRLAPDRRFLIAISALDRIATGRSADSVTASFDSTTWEIRSGRERIAELPEAPDYASLRAMLATEATRAVAELLRRDAARTPPPNSPSFAAARAAIDRELGDLHALRALDDADRLWAAGEHGAGTAGRAADALALLMLETEDRVGSSDSLAGTALAMMAIASAMDSATTRRTECLLADRLNYGAAAAEIAARLPADDPRRAFVLRDDSHLGASARSSEAAFLRLARLAERSDLEAWAPAADRFQRDRALALPLLATGLALGRFESNPDIGESMLRCVSDDLGILERAGNRHAVTAGRDLGNLMNEFEDLLANMPPSADGPLLDRAVVRSYYRSCFYSGIRAISDHLLYSLASLPDSRDLARELASARPGPALEFSHWFHDLVDSRSGRPWHDALPRDLAHLDHFGQPLIDSWMDEYFGSTGLGAEPEYTMALARQVAGRLDSRPWGRVTLATVVRCALLDPAQSDALCASALNAVGMQDSGWRRWWAGFDGDSRTLLAIAAEPAYTSEERAHALELASEVAPEDSVAVMAAHQRLLAELPDDFRAVGRYAHEFEDRGQLGRARGALEAWLASPRRSGWAFDEISARTSIARILQVQGHAQEAYAMIQPVVGSEQGGAMDRGALILWDLGRAAEAETLAFAAWRRYPDSGPAREVVARMLWRKGDDEFAARVLLDRELLSNEDWRHELAPELLRLDHAHPGAALEAAKRIAARGDNGRYAADQLAAAFSFLGADSLAFEVASRLPLPGDAGGTSEIRAYRYLSRVRGEPAAAAWIRNAVSKRSSSDRHKLLCQSLGFGAARLLWELPWPPLDGESQESLWMVRAAAVAGDPSLPAGWQQEVRRHFEHPGPGRYRTFGRFMLGLESQDAAIHAANTHRALGEATYLIGLKALQQGHLREAASWYARCVSLDERRNIEDYWARTQLCDWIYRQHSMGWIERQAARERARPVAVANP